MNDEEVIVSNAKWWAEYPRSIEEGKESVKGLLMLLESYQSTIMQMRACLAPQRFFVYEQSVLNKRIDELELSVRVAHCLRNYNLTLISPILTIGDLIKLSHNELRKIPNLGRKSLDELVQEVEKLGVQWSIYGTWGEAIKKKLVN